MPPSRRQTRTTPPTRRPRVAGLRRPGTPAPEPEPPVLDTDEPEAVSHAEPADVPEPDRAEADPTEDHPADTAEDGPEDVLDEPVGDRPEDATADQPADDSQFVIFGERPSPRRRPAGKGRSIGITQPGDLAEAEAEVAGDRSPTPQRRRVSPVTLTIGLTVLALVLAGLAVWFRGAADRRSEAADINNAALTDPGAAVEVTEKLRTTLEQTLSFNYTDLDSTEKAVRENLAGKAACEYEQLFGEVRKLAPDQKIVVSAQVRDIGLIRLEGDKAQALVFLDQRSTRADQNQAAVSGAQFTVHAERQDGQWKITGFDLLGQPLAGGKPAPQC